MLFAENEDMYRSGGTPLFILNLGLFMETSGSFHAKVALPQGEESL